MQRRASVLVAAISAAVVAVGTAGLTTIGGLGAAVAAAASGPISTPANVVVTSVSSNSIGLSWSASTVNDSSGDSAAYYVYSGSNIVATSMGTNVTVSSLKPSTSYSFTLQAYDAAGNVSSASAPVSAATSAPATPGFYKTAYFAQWGIYGNGYDVSNVQTTGVAGKLSTLVYAFENIDPSNLTCFEAI